MAAISRSRLPNLFFEPYLINIRCLKYVIQLEAGFILLQAYKKLSLFMTILAKKIMTFL